ncbi:MAG: alkaline phosphatase family protein [Rikenellaceae bacterium]
MHKITLLIILLFSFSAKIANSQNTQLYDEREKPKLVLQIVVSHFRYDYLTKFNKNASEFGIKRLLKNGTNFTNARYGFMFTQTSPCIATIATGAQPSQHGIIGDSWVNFTTNENIDAILDLSVHGVGSNEDEGQYSPHNLVFSTLADELKRQNSKSKVVSIAMDARGAVIAGGYNPDGVYWFDQRYGNMSTSTYYKPILPYWVTKFNESDKKNQYASELWSLTNDYNTYTYQNATSVLVDASKKLSFDFKLKQKNKDMNRLLETPFGNSFIKDFALEVIKNDSLGMDENPDLLIVNFGATHKITEKYGVESTEIEDAFYKLDNDIAELIDYLENTLGKENVVIILTSNHGTSDNVSIDGVNAIQKEHSTKTFNAMQFEVLINGFLGAMLGADQWVNAYKNRQIYLNRRLIYEKGLSLSDIQTQVATFALQFGGVANAMTATALQNNYYGKGMTHKIQNSFFPKYSGDVIINLLPGWIELERENASWVISSSGSPYEYDTHVPLIWYGGSITPNVVHRPVDIINVAPTLSEILGISHPNASEGEALSEIITQLN